MYRKIKINTMSEKEKKRLDVIIGGLTIIILISWIFVTIFMELAYAV